jgi:predicted N-acetyltransferase YhbS
MGRRAGFICQRTLWETIWVCRPSFAFSLRGSLVDALRQRKAYRSDLSLVAVHEGTIIGHVLFNHLQLHVGGLLLNGPSVSHRRPP